MNTNHRLVSIFDGDAATLDLLLRHYAATRGPVIVDVIPVGSDGGHSRLIPGFVRETVE
ncbi:MAG TPA: hypothetical protein PLS46_09260 [Microthrixaceae bacterium]|nr:hypothetical protein [Microthrixaceae bacterium]